MTKKKNKRVAYFGEIKIANETKFSLMADMGLPLWAQGGILVGFSGYIFLFSVLLTKSEKNNKPLFLLIILSLIFFIYKLYNNLGNLQSELREIENARSKNSFHYNLITYVDSIEALSLVCKEMHNMLNDNLLETKSNKNNNLIKMLSTPNVEFPGRIMGFLHDNPKVFKYQDAKLLKIIKVHPKDKIKDKINK